jgi:hypothetical protein
LFDTTAPDCSKRTSGGSRNGSKKRFSPAHRGIRARGLSIVAIPNVALPAVGIGAAGYLVVQSSAATDWATRIQEIIPSDIDFVTQVADTG